MSDSVMTAISNKIIKFKNLYQCPQTTILNTYVRCSCGLGNNDSNY